MGTAKENAALGVGLIGCGTVGSGVVALLQDEAELYERRLGRRMELRRVLVRAEDVGPKTQRVGNIPALHAKKLALWLGVRLPTTQEALAIVQHRKVNGGWIWTDRGHAVGLARGKPQLTVSENSPEGWDPQVVFVR